MIRAGMTVVETQQPEARLAGLAVRSEGRRLALMSPGLSVRLTGGQCGCRFPLRTWVVLHTVLAPGSCPCLTVSGYPSRIRCPLLPPTGLALGLELERLLGGLSF